MLLIRDSRLENVADFNLPRLLHIDLSNNNVKNLKNLIRLTARSPDLVCVAGCLRATESHKSRPNNRGWCTLRVVVRLWNGVRRCRYINVLDNPVCKSSAWKGHKEELPGAKSKAWRMVAQCPHLGILNDIRLTMDHHTAAVRAHVSQHHGRLAVINW